MDRLTFGTRARRQARYQRVVLRASLLVVVASIAGLPGADLGLQLLEAPTRAMFGFTEQPNSEFIETSESAAGLMRFRAEVFGSRPTPTPTPTVVAVAAAPLEPAPIVAADYSGSVSEIIYAAASEFGISGSYLLSVASCESGLNPSAYNSAGYYGLFQFDQSTWAANGYGSIYDPVAQSRTAARLLAAGQASRWPNCA